MLCFEFWILFLSLFCCSSSCSVCLIAAQTEKVARKKKKIAPLSHTQLTNRNMPCKTEAQFQPAPCIFPQARKQQAGRETNNLQSTKRVFLQSLSFTKLMQEHSSLGIKFKGMFSYIYPLNRTVENVHKHTLCKLFMFLAEIICTLERGERYPYLHEHNYWINTPSSAKIKDSLSLSPHSLQSEEISKKKENNSCLKLLRTKLENGILWNELQMLFIKTWHLFVQKH